MQFRSLPKVQQQLAQRMFGDETETGQVYGWKRKVFTLFSRKKEPKKVTKGYKGCSQ
jgi:hypothetical protein